MFLLPELVGIIGTILGPSNFFSFKYHHISSSFLLGSRYVAQNIDVNTILCALIRANHHYPNDIINIYLKCPPNIVSDKLILKVNPDQLKIIEHHYSKRFLQLCPIFALNELPSTYENSDLISRVYVDNITQFNPLVGCILTCKKWYIRTLFNKNAIYDNFDEYVRDFDFQTFTWTTLCLHLNGGIGLPYIIYNIIQKKIIKHISCDIFVVDVSIPNIEFEYSAQRWAFNIVSQILNILDVEITYYDSLVELGLVDSSYPQGLVNAIERFVEKDHNAGLTFIQNHKTPEQLKTKYGFQLDENKCLIM